jgi:hypothetical protein
MEIKASHSIIDKWPMRRLRKQKGEPGAKEELLEKAGSRVPATTRFVEWKRASTPDPEEFEATLKEVEEWDYDMHNSNVLVKKGGRGGEESPWDVEDVCVCGSGRSLEGLWADEGSPEQAAAQAHVRQVAQKTGAGMVIFG